MKSQTAIHQTEFMQSKKMNDSSYRLIFVVRYEKYRPAKLAKFDYFSIRVGKCRRTLGSKVVHFFVRNTKILKIC